MRRRIDRVVAVAVLTSGIAGFAAAADREPALWTSAPRHKPAISASAFADLAERARAAVVHVRGEVTEGTVSAKERVVDRSTLREPHQQDIYSFFIQTDASINLGNSGGPLIDAGGAVIGVSAAFWAGHPLQPAQGIGFAIPINMAKALLPRLARDGSARRSYLGVDAQPLDAALESAVRLASGRGALIASIEKGSPAEAA